MITGCDAVEAARLELGTPYGHQGRLAGVLLDCSGLCVVTAKKLGIDLIDRNDYRRPPNHDDFIEALRLALTEIPVTSAGVGDWLVFWLHGRRKWPQHMAMLTDLGPDPQIIHAVEARKKVVEHSLLAPFRRSRWNRMVSHAFRVPGMMPGDGALGNPEELI